MRCDTHAHKMHFEENSTSWVDSILFHNDSFVRAFYFWQRIEVRHLYHGWLLEVDMEKASLFARHPQSLNAAISKAHAKIALEPSALIMECCQ